MSETVRPSGWRDEPKMAADEGDEIGSFKDQLTEFLKGAAEMSVEFGKGCRDIVRQSLEDENSFLVKNFGKDSVVGGKVTTCCEKVGGKLKFLNEYLAEDKDPVHVWSVILLVVILTFATLYASTEEKISVPITKKVYIHPPSASRISLPDGRYMAYNEQGVPVERARWFVITPHSFVSSRLAGIPGIKASLLEEFGVCLLTYDLPGFGESDPHPTRNLESSALDMSHLANALGINDKFWVVGYSGGGMHAWAALKYIPDKIAGAAMFAPMVNPYDPAMTRAEKQGTWGKWTRSRKFMFFLARRFPSFLPYFYHRSFLSGRHDQIDRWLSLSLGERDKALIEDPIHEEFWQRDVEEAIRQGDATPFVQEATLQVSEWGFSLEDLRLQKKRREKGIRSWLKWLKSVLKGEEEYTGFFGPIHIWQGMDDRVVPPSMTDFVHRLLPGAAVHKLPYEGHFTYFCFCDECHRQIFTTLFGTPQGPLSNTMEENETLTEGSNTEESQTCVEASSSEETQTYVEGDSTEENQTPFERNLEEQEEVILYNFTESSEIISSD